MKLIEKKCPNCGANLEFSENDKNCTCSYCHRSFEIERDQNDLNEYILNIISSEDAKKIAKTGLNIFATTSIMSIIVSIFIFIIAIGLFGFIFFSAFKEMNKKEEKEKVEVKNPVTDISQLNNTDLKLFSDSSYSFMSVKGENSNKYSYHDEDHEVYKYVLASKDKKNYLYVVSEVLYINFFNTKDKMTVYIPVRYENVVNNMDYFDDSYKEIINSKMVDAPKYYLNKEKSSYISGGYSKYDSFVKDKIEPLKNDGYKITEK